MSTDSNTEVMTAKLNDYSNWLTDNGFVVGSKDVCKLIEETYKVYAYALNSTRRISLHDARTTAAKNLNFKEVAQ